MQRWLRSQHTNRRRHQRLASIALCFPSVASALLIPPGAFRYKSIAATENTHRIVTLPCVNPLRWIHIYPSLTLCVFHSNSAWLIPVGAERGMPQRTRPRPTHPTTHSLTLFAPGTRRRVSIKRSTADKDRSLLDRHVFYVVNTLSSHSQSARRAAR